MWQWVAGVSMDWRFKLARESPGSESPCARAGQPPLPSPRAVLETITAVKSGLQPCGTTCYGAVSRLDHHDDGWPHGKLGSTRTEFRVDSD